MHKDSQHPPSCESLFSELLGFSWQFTHNMRSNVCLSEIALLNQIMHAFALQSFLEFPVIFKSISVGCLFMKD